MKPLRLFEEDRAPQPDPKLFGRTPEDAFNHPGLKFSDKAVLAVLAFFAMNSYPIVRQSRAQIAAKTGITERGLFDVLQRLVKYKFVELTRDYDRRGSPHIIRLLSEFRTPFALTSDPPAPRRRSASNRKRAAGCNQKRGSGCNRNGASGSLFREDLERENQRPSPPRVVEPAATPAEEGEGDSRALSRDDFAALTGYRPRNSPPVKTPAAGSSAKIPPPPAGATISCDPLYPEEQNEPTKPPLTPLI
jgi:hypothetical protein